MEPVRQWDSPSELDSADLGLERDAEAEEDAVAHQPRKGEDVRRRRALAADNDVRMLAPDVRPADPEVLRTRLLEETSRVIARRILEEAAICSGWEFFALLKIMGSGNRE